jgi:hypothetical protein
MNCFHDAVHGDHLHCLCCCCLLFLGGGGCKGYDSVLGSWLCAAHSHDCSAPAALLGFCLVQVVKGDDGVLVSRHEGPHTPGWLQMCTHHEYFMCSRMLAAGREGHDGVLDSRLCAADAAHDSSAAAALL